VQWSDIFKDGLVNDKFVKVSLDPIGDDDVFEVPMDRFSDC
jgi:hypothetical protein